MKPDPIGIDPAAIVQPALFADVLTALLSEAQGFGRKTIEHKVACGRKLIEAKDEWQKRNETLKPKERTAWSKHLKRFGFNERAAQRLMAAARSHKEADNLSATPRPFSADAIYDDGVDPETPEGKKSCRECRMRGKAFSKKCAGCRAFNREPPKPKEDKPLTDMDGILVPEHLIPTFREGEIIRDLTAYLSTATQALGGLTERPGCAALPVGEMTKRLRSLKAFALLHRPGQVHAECEGRGCNGCRDGWRTIKTVMEERAVAANAKAREKAKDWHAKKNVSSQPIPE